MASSDKDLLQQQQQGNSNADTMADAVHSILSLPPSPFREHLLQALFLGASGAVPVAPKVQPSTSANGDTLGGGAVGAGNSTNPSKRPRNDREEDDCRIISDCRPGGGAVIAGSSTDPPSKRQLVDQVCIALKDDLPWFPCARSMLLKNTQIIDAVDGETGYILCPVCSKPVEAKRTRVRQEWSVVDYTKHVPMCIVKIMVQKKFGYPEPPLAAVLEYFRGADI